MTAVWWILGILAVLFLVYLWLIAPAGKKPDDSALKGWLYAHRGLHDGNHQVAENSLEAFRRAMETGYGMELDVQLTADDQLVVFHDKNLKRVCGVDKDLYTQTYAQLMEYPLPDGSKIPLFSEVLALVDGKTPMIVEVKYHDRIEQTCEATYDQLRRYKGACCVESFHRWQCGGSVNTRRKWCGRAGFRRQVEAGRTEQAGAFCDEVSAAAVPDPAPFRGLLRGGGWQPEHVAGKEAVQALSGGLDDSGSEADGSGTEGVRLSDL